MKYNGLAIKIMKDIIFLFIFLTYINIISSQKFAYDDDDELLFPDWEIFYSPLDRALPSDYIVINNCKFRVIPNTMNILCGSKCTELPKRLNITTPLFKIQITHIQKIGKNDFDERISDLLALEIEGNIKFKYLEPGCFQHFTNLSNLTMTSNPNLLYLEEDVFTGLVNLKVLCLSKNGFTHVIDVTRACSANILPKLKLLDFEDHMFNEVKKDEFLPMVGSNLQQLNLLMCQIIYIHPSSLIPLKNLTQLRLGQNLFNRTTLTDLIITTLKSGIELGKLNLFQIGLRKTSPYEMLEAIGKTKLYALVLSSNTFNTIDNDWFPAMPNLWRIDLRLCLIVNIGENAFNNLTGLTSLRIGGNRFTEFPIAVTKIKFLEVLEMTAKFDEDQSGIVFYIPDGSFQKLHNLKILRLNYKNLGSISKNLFIGATQLTNLCLKNTSLNYIEEGAFSHLPNLKYLNLINNPLLKTMPLTSEVFHGLGNLNILDLGGCALKNLTERISLFQYLQNLTHLGLEYNSITAINPNQLRHLHSLKELYLSDNQLAPWSKRILPTPNLKIMYANQNKFTYITTAMLEDWQHLEGLYLQDNPLVCDCSLYSVVEWLKENSMSLKQLQSDDFIANCLAPEEWRHKSVVEYLAILSAQDNICEKNLLKAYKTMIILLIIGIIVIAIASILIYLNRWYLRYWIFLCRLNFLKHNPWKQQKNKTNVKNGLQYDAFVSYCNLDRLFVMQMIDELEKKEPPLKLCVYERDFAIGASISQAILESIGSSKRTVLVVSNDFVKSHWCQWESQLAEYHQLFFNDDEVLGLDDTLLLIKFSNLQMKSLSPTLKYLLRTRIYLEWEPHDNSKQQDFWQKLKMVLALPKGQLREVK